MQRLLSATICLWSLAITPLALVSAPLNNDGPILMIFPPWKDLDHALAQTGAVEISPLRAPFAALIEAPTEHIQTALINQGAWTLLDGAFIAQLCGV